jgi:hypothetical protein
VVRHHMEQRKTSHWLWRWPIIRSLVLRILVSPCLFKHQQPPLLFEGARRELLFVLSRLVEYSPVQPEPLEVWVSVYAPQYVDEFKSSF